MTRSFSFSNPHLTHLHHHILQASQRGLELARHGELQGARVAVAATGPTLTAKRLGELRQLAAHGWQIWALKEAMTVLTAADVPVHATVAMDPDAGQRAKYPRAPGVTYWLASSCAPELFDHLAGLDVRIYHSATGWLGKVPHRETGEMVQICEIHLYRYAYERADCIVGGYTVSNRALGLAKYLGADEVRLFGTPFGWRPEGGYYAQGVTGAAGNQGHDLRIDLPGDRSWLTRPDLCASAIHVAIAIRAGDCSVAGDSLAGAIARQPDDLLHRLFPGQWPNDPQHPARAAPAPQPAA